MEVLIGIVLLLAMVVSWVVVVNVLATVLGFVALVVGVVLSVGLEMYLKEEAARLVEGKSVAPDVPPARVRVRGWMGRR